MAYLIVAAALLGGTLAFVGFAAKLYNNLVSLRNQCQNGFSQIEVQLKRRYDLIPNLVECVRSYMKHESQTLENVIKARNQAATGLAAAAKNPTNAAALQSLMGAEGALAGAMGKLSFVMENYPDLKANESVAQLTEELSSTENKVAFARQAYNDWATGFNTYRQTFPTVFFAGFFGFGENLSLVEFDKSEAIHEAPVVALATNG